MLYILIGTIASGKSSWASKQVEHDPNAVIVNKDAIRTMLKSSYIFDPLYEDLVREIGYLAVCEALFNKWDVVVDDTNLTKAHRKKFIDTIQSRIKNLPEITYVYFTECVGNVDRRMASDSRGYSRTKWSRINEKMLASFEAPTFDEHPSITTIRTVNFSGESNQVRKILK